MRRATVLCGLAAAALAATLVLAGAATAASRPATATATATTRTETQRFAVRAQRHLESVANRPGIASTAIY